MADGGINFDLKNNKVEGENVERRGWSTLLPDLLMFILSRLMVLDKIHASAVCREWYKASVSIQERNRSLWLMKHPLDSRIKKTSELYDPSEDVTYTKEFPEIACMTIHYSKDGWLLMHKESNDQTSEMVFFNPLTRTVISLPVCSYIECAIFTCSPTFDNCLVFGLTNIDVHNNIVAVKTLKVGEAEWKTYRFRGLERMFAYYNKIIFSEGFFYCFGGSGSVAVFDPSNETWNTHRPKFDEGFAPSSVTWFGTYFVEISGEIFFLKTLGEKPRLFQLNRIGSWIWEEKERFEEGSTFFGTFHVSEFRKDLADDMKNRLFLTDWHHPMINTYIFGEDKYLQGVSGIPVWDGKTQFQTIWIESPKQCLDFI